jgi:hypothetical protein
MNLLRTIKKITISETVKSFFSRWKIEGKEYDSSVDVLFPIGCIGISSKSKSWINKFQAENKSLLVSDASPLIKKFSLKDGDFLYGDENNHLLLQDQNIIIKTKSLSINCQDINITTSGNITINGVLFSFSENKVSIGGNEVAVVGGDVSTVTNKITTSGQ